MSRRGRNGECILRGVLLAAIVIEDDKSCFWARNVPGRGFQAFFTVEVVLSVRPDLQ